jgi:hypothetical protein
MQYLNLDTNLPKPEVVTVEGIANDALHILEVNK